MIMEATSSFVDNEATNGRDKKNEPLLCEENLGTH